MFIPKTISIAIKDFCSSLGLSAEPVYIQVKAEPWALFFHCFDNVQKMIEQSGGSRVIGWALSESPLIMEAIFHAVYKPTDGGLIDITPQLLPIDKILFVEDMTTPYTGIPRDSYRSNITNNPVVDDLIKLEQLQFAIMNYHERAYQTFVHIKGKDAILLQNISSVKFYLELFALRGMGPLSPCFCDSNKSYLECHGPIISEFLDLHLAKYQY